METSMGLKGLKENYLSKIFSMLLRYFERIFSTLEINYKKTGYCDWTIRYLKTHNVFLFSLLRKNGSHDLVREEGKSLRFENE